MKFVLASHNRGKLQEMQAILSHLGVEVVLQSDLGLNLEPEETGTTFMENAAIKARAVAQASGLPAIADDSGLCVDWLNGAPGIYSARYGGVGSDAERYQLLLQNMRGATNRAAHFHTAVVCCFPDGRQLTAQGDCYGTIAFAPMGEGGFGYDPVFFVPELRKTFAQLTAEEKNAISHRGNALRQFAQVLQEDLEKNGYGTDK
ncbi:MAG: XTP/dITP diphosphatase [Oscillospiraceae bacterium]|nr:XTP/dITP diphosphatase [Oscillospiraceae bacterium]MBR0211434.1 XTP/dITP diphosphatase [Oscillospiraceae bacterium]